MTRQERAVVFGAFLAHAVLPLLAGAAAASPRQRHAAEEVEAELISQKWGLPGLPLLFPETQEAEPATPDKYDCGVSTSSALLSAQDWNAKRRRWCCEHQKTCIVDGAERPQINCSVSAKHLTKPVQERCCKHWHLHCPAAANASSSSDKEHGSEPFDCVAGFAHWERLWSSEKRKSCCKRFHRGCPRSTTTAALFDCSADVENWRTSWSAGKRESCCHATGRGCSPPSAHSPPARTTTTTTTAAAAAAASRASSEAELEPEYECDATRRGEAEWSKEEKAWCCRHSGQGCGAAATKHATLLFDCDRGFARWRKSWSELKITWCCKTSGRACFDTAAARLNVAASDQATAPAPAPAPVATSATTTLPYDCYNGYVNYQTAWSNGKKAWCCLRMGRACPKPEPTMVVTSTATTTVTTTVTTTITTTSTSMSDLAASPSYDPYDCQAALLTWQQSWSLPKRTWCCAHKQLGCAESHLEKEVHQQFDCKEDFDRWLEKWDISKRSWCCKHQPALAGHAMCFMAVAKFSELAHPVVADGVAPRASTAAAVLVAVSLSSLVAAACWAGGLGLRASSRHGAEDEALLHTNGAGLEVE